MTNSAVTATDHIPDANEYRIEVRTWLSENLVRRQGPMPRHEIDYFTPNVMAANRALQRTLFEGGYAGITWPKEYGGGGLPDEFEAIFQDEAAGYVLPDFGVLSGTTMGVCVPTILSYASANFLRSFIPKVLAGDALVCQFFSEPSSGSDLAGARTTATKDGEQWILNGQKIWSTYAHLADWGLCLARTDWEVPKHSGLTWFAVPCHASGVTIRPIRQINDSAEFCEDFFDDVVIPDEYRVGDVNQGWTVTQTLLVLERGAGRAGDSRSLIGPGPLAPDLVKLAQEAGRVDDPVVRQKLARAHTNDYVGRVLASRIGELGHLGRLNAGVAAYGKLFGGTYNPIRARIAVEIGGGAAVGWGVDDEHGSGVST